MLEENAGNRVEVLQVASKSLVGEKRATGKPSGRIVQDIWMSGFGQINVKRS